MLSNRALLLLPLMICFNLACGGLEEDVPVESAEYAFKHGPGPGPPYSYVLTTFTGGKMACGGYANGTSYYSTGEWMFRNGGKSGCGTKLKVKANGKCVVVKVADNGPASWVESKAKSKCGGTGYVLDVSPVVSKYLYGTSGSGWSDCRKVEVWEVAASTPTGPTSCGGVPPVNDGKSWIGEGCGGPNDCSSGDCAQGGYPDGMCTQNCAKYCPDRSGKPTTFCVALDGQNGQCFSQCSGGSCRPGYVCVEVPRHNEPSVRRSVCVPQSLENQAKALTPGNPSGAWIGEACNDPAQCASGACFLPADGYQGGMCSQDCPPSNLCPDRAGSPTTFCVALDGVTGHCYARCDYNAHPGGCRPGYTCSKLPRHNEPWVKRNTCVPSISTTSTNFVGEPPDDEGDLPNPENMVLGSCSVGRRSTGLPGLMLILVLALLALRRP